MKHKIATMLIAASSALGATAQTADNHFKYTDEKFADIQMLRYKVEGFDKLSLKEKTFIYYLQEAALEGRDILFDQTDVIIFASVPCSKLFILIMRESTMTNSIKHSQCT